MRLFIVRHGIAVPQGTPGVKEEDRPLTEEGVDKMRRAAKGIDALGVLPDIIMSSPLPRARQTAEILLAEFGKNVSLECTESLAPSGNRREVYGKLQALPQIEAVMLVGHQPLLGEMAGEIAWGSPENYLELKKGGTCCIDLVTLKPMPRGTLLWLVTPSILRALG